MKLEGSTPVISWNPVSSKVPLAGYVVYRASPGDDQGTPLMGAPIKNLIYRDRGARKGNSYVYWVIAQTMEGKHSPASRKTKKVKVPKSSSVVPFF